MAKTKTRKYRVQITVPLAIDVLVEAPSNKAASNWFNQLGDTEIEELVEQYENYLIPEGADAYVDLVKDDDDEAKQFPDYVVNSGGKEQ